MKSVHFSILILFTSLFIQICSYAQSVVGSSGGFDGTSNAHINWTLGELMIGSFENPGSHIGEGFNQPAYSLTSLSDNPQLGILKVYPNPVEDLLIIETVQENSQLEFEIFDINGKVVARGNKEGLKNHIDLSMISSGSYQLILKTKESQSTNSYKLIKN